MVTILMLSCFKWKGQKLVIFYCFFGWSMLYARNIMNSEWQTCMHEDQPLKKITTNERTTHTDTQNLINMIIIIICMLLMTVVFVASLYSFRVHCCHSLLSWQLVFLSIFFPIKISMTSKRTYVYGTIQNKTKRNREKRMLNRSLTFF